MISQEERLKINKLNEIGLRERDGNTEIELSEITFNEIFAHLKETHNLPYVKDNWYNLSKSDKEEIIKKWYFNYQNMFREILNSELFFVFEIENK